MLNWNIFVGSWTPLGVNNHQKNQLNWCFTHRTQTTNFVMGKTTNLEEGCCKIVMIQKVAWESVPWGYNNQPHIGFTSITSGQTFFQVFRINNSVLFWKKIWVIISFFFFVENYLSYFCFYILNGFFFPALFNVLLFVFCMIFGRPTADFSFQNFFPSLVCIAIVSLLSSKCPDLIHFIIIFWHIQTYVLDYSPTRGLHDLNSRPHFDIGHILSRSH